MVVVLENDVPPAGFDYTTLAIAVQSDDGEATVSYHGNNPSSSHLRFRADAGFVGTTTFAYRICDTAGVCDTAVVTMTITAT